MRQRYLILIFLGLNILSSSGQIERHLPHQYELNHSENLKNTLILPLSNDTSYNVHFYHLDVEIALDFAFIEGSVSYLFTSKIDGLQQLVLDLDNSFTIDSISSPADTYTFDDDALTIHFSHIYNQGEDIRFTVYYHGQPPLAGGYKGLRYETHDGNQPIIASLSTPYIAHTWWPCKDGTQDKADSTFIDITIKDTIIQNIPVIAVSNGILDTVVTHEGNKTFKWKHYYPIVPYYVMVAISNYEHFQQVYEGEGYSFPIDYYVFHSHLNDAKNGVSKIPDVMDYFTNTFGDYPFRNEKYGMTQLGYYGGIENQTNTIINNMSSSWFSVSVHELAHQWFADMITCNTWHHAWLNEGFANYAEALYDEYSNGFESYQSYISNDQYFGNGSLYLHDVSNPFTVFRSIIYKKGSYLLHMLRGVVGDPVFFEILKAYATDEEFKYKNATTENFQSICENISDQNLDYFFSQWVYDEYYPIYRYNYLFDEDTGDIDISIHQTQAENGWKSVFAMPMEIKIEYEDFTDTIVRVFNDGQFQVFSFNLAKKVRSIELDPNNWILKKSQFDPTISVSVLDIEPEIFTVFPNPTNQIITIKSIYEGRIDIVLLDMNGNKKLMTTRNPSKQKEYTVDLNGLPEGIYLLKIKTKNKEYVKRVVVMN